MKPYLLSLGAGVLVGVVYVVLGVKSPAPPMIALIGLLGILLGEQAALLARRGFGNEAMLAFVRIKCARQVPGTLRPDRPEREA